MESLKISRKFKRDHTESLKLTGTYWWLLGKPQKALRWWKKSIDLGEKLGAKLELSRTYFEAGKRLSLSSLRKKRRGRSRTKNHRPHSGGMPREGRDMFKEMDLQWDLAELEKVKSGIKP